MILSQYRRNYRFGEIQRFSCFAIIASDPFSLFNDKLTKKKKKKWGIFFHFNKRKANMNTAGVFTNQKVTFKQKQNHQAQAMQLANGSLKQPCKIEHSKMSYFSEQKTSNKQHELSCKQRWTNNHTWHTISELLVETASQFVLMQVVYITITVMPTLSSAQPLSIKTRPICSPKYSLSPL